MGRDNFFWLTPQEVAYVINELLQFGLIKYSNARDLPLKSGGKTDIYINLREARSNPDAIAFLATVFFNPLLRLGIERFVEVPDSVSCFAGPLAIKSGLPYITVRESAKEGRVAKAKVIGRAGRGEKVCIIDDVITDGASKLSPYKECLSMGVKLLPLVVLVDRQQGWEETFKKLGVQMNVWAGMTLHDVRKYLIMNGIMERCDRGLEENNPLIVALDGMEWDHILPIIDPLRTTGCILKVNDMLLNEGIKNIIPDLEVYGRVMADLKCHDIKNTVKNITTHLLPNPPWAVTVHASGGEEMIKAAVETLKDTPTKVLAVTVLTSISSTTCEEIYTRSPLDQVKKLAGIAERAGAHGLVCSPEEVAELKSLYPKMIFVTPGIRSEGSDKGDQKRVSTPEAALANGADYLVMGRQILGAADPVAEVTRLLKEEINV